MQFDPTKLNQKQDLIFGMVGRADPSYGTLPENGEIHFSLELNAVSLIDVILPTGDPNRVDAFFRKQLLTIGAVSDFSEPLNLTIRFSVSGGAYLPLDQFVLATVPKPGDANGDGRADGADYIAWASNFRRTSRNGSVDGDFNHDGFVDGRDYIEWANAFDSSSAATTIAIPEPASLISLFAGVALLAGPVLRRSRTRR